MPALRYDSLFALARESHDKCIIIVDLFEDITEKSTLIQNTNRRVHKGHVYDVVRWCVACVVLLWHGVVSFDAHPPYQLKVPIFEHGSPPTPTHRCTLNQSLFVRPRYDQDRSFEPMGWVTCPLRPENSPVI